MSPKRRAVLTTSAIGLQCAIAGCLGNLVPDSQGTGRIDLGRQLPAPGVFGRETLAAPFRYFDVDALGAESPEFADPLAGQYELSEVDALLSLAGVEPDDLELLVTALLYYSVAVGDFDVEAIDGTLEDRGFAFESEDDGAKVYEIEGRHGKAGAVGIAEDRVVSVGTGLIDEDGLLIGRTFDDPVETARQLLAFPAEDEHQYVRTDPYIGALVEQLGAGMAGVGNRRQARETDIDAGEFAGQQAWGAEFDIHREHTSFTEVFVFEAGMEPPREDVETWLASDHPHHWGQHTATEDPSITIDESVLVITGELDTADGFRIA